MTTTLQQITGVERSLAELARVMRNAVMVSRKGAVAAGLLIQREAMRRCPEDLGNLVGSAFTVWPDGPPPTFSPRPGTPSEAQDQLAVSFSETLATANAYFRERDSSTMVVVGFGAYYALYVHENVNGNVPRAGGKGEHHFLSNAIADKQNEVVSMISGALDGSLGGTH